MCPPTDLDGQSNKVWNVESPQEDQNVGVGRLEAGQGWPHGLFHRWGKGSPDREGLARPQSLGQWILGPDWRPQLPFPPGAPGWQGNKRACDSGRDEWLALGDVPWPRWGLWWLRKPPHTELHSGAETSFLAPLYRRQTRPLHMWPCPSTPALRFLEEALRGKSLFFQYVSYTAWTK